jgi:hypothetical protein
MSVSVERARPPTSFVSRGSFWRCKSQVAADESRSWFHSEAHRPVIRQADRRPYASWHHKTNSGALACWLAKFQGGKWAAGERSLWRREAGTTKTAKPPIPVEHCRPRAEGHPSLRENHGQRHLQLCFGPVVSDHRTSPGLVDNCHFILSLFYKFACLVPLHAGPGIHFARLLTLAFFPKAAASRLDHHQKAEKTTREARMRMPD